MAHKPYTWIELSKSAFEHNLALLRPIIGSEAKLALVIKGNAYGHGMRQMAQLGQESPNLDWFYVTNLAEALQLRSLGATKPILATSILDADPALACTHDIDLVVYDAATITRLNAIGKQLNKRFSVHIKIDTGMSRYGFMPDRALSVIQQIAKLPFLQLNGIYTHFSSSDENNLTTTEQLFKFVNLLNVIEQHGIIIPLCHTNNTAATITAGNAHTNLARIGAGAYGMWPSEHVRTLLQERNKDAELKQVLTWKTTIEYIKEVPAGSFVGYNQTYQANQHMRIAILPIGYYDGYDRRLTNNGTVFVDSNNKVLVHNNYAPVVGRVCMNVTMIDVTNISSAQVGDEVTLLGNRPHICARDLANAIGSFNPREITTRLNPNIARFIVP